MNFFEQLSSLGNVDMTIRIMQKNDKLTLNIMPAAGQTKILPILVTGTPAELDAEFFKTIVPGVTEISGLVTNMEEVKKQVEEESKKADSQKTEVKSKKVETPAPVKTEKSEEPDLFAE